MTERACHLYFRCESTGYWERAGLKLMQPKRVLLPLMAPNTVCAPTEEHSTRGRRTKPCHGEELKRGLGAAAPSLRPHELAGEPAGPHRRGAAALCEAQGEASAPGEASSQQPAGSWWGIRSSPNALTPQNSSLALRLRCPIHKYK